MNLCSPKFFKIFVKKVPFFIYIKLSLKVPGWPRFAPFHCKIWKFSGGASPPEPPLWWVSPRCARLGNLLTRKVYCFLKKSTVFWGKIYCHPIFRLAGLRDYHVELVLLFPKWGITHFFQKWSFIVLPLSSSFAFLLRLKHFAWFWLLMLQLNCIN